MKRILIAALAVVLAAPVVMAQGVVGSAHDLSGYSPDTDEVCVFCHTPHGANVDPVRATNELPLWNHTMSAAGVTYTVYDSVTMDQHPGDAGYADFTGASGLSTNLCMSCHDGTVGINDLVNGPGPGDAAIGITPSGNINATGHLFQGPAFLDDDLTNDHPVNIDYAASQGSDTGLVAGAGGLQLFNGRIQCATCHDPHDDSNTMFLVETNAASALCLNCHNK